MNTLSSNRVVVYLQSQENLNLLPQCYANLTAINLSSFHFGWSKTKPTLPYIHLNDNMPGDPMFDSLWADMKAAQQNGVLLIAMLGGAGGAYTTLFSQGNYEVFYPMFVNMLKKYNFQGVDLDVEEQVSQADIEKLIADLRKDFPTDFYITSAPVCSALQSGNNDPFSGINWYSIKDSIDWFNVQFYSGFGSLSTPDDYNSIIDNGFSASQILGGALTNPADGGGYVAIATVAQTLQTLNTKYSGQIGGAMGWEYFNANNASEQEDPVGWATAMKNAVS
ncbi:glycosyl hydrolase family 18 protein [Taibaiella lutea]|nr:glycosyl hydrolase family 18 protein [Taibaiella lutea]